MSNKELRLKYLVELASNIAPKARQEAAAFEEANKRMGKAVATTDKGVTELGKKVEAQGPAALKQAQVVEDANRRMASALGRTERSAAALDNRLRSLANNTSMERQVSYMDRLAQSYDRVAQKASQLKQAALTGIDKVPEVAMQVGAGYYGGRAMMMPPIRAFSDLETAVSDLRVAMLKRGGNIDGSFGAIMAEAGALGQRLPGSTKDFAAGARALVEQGTPLASIANGALRASANFGVLMDMDQAGAAETIAKVREAYGLDADQLPKMADLMQRGRYAFGLNPQDFRMVASYAAPTYNSMGLTGLENAKRLMAVQGMAASVGLESSSFGTNFSQMLARLSQIDGRTNKNSPEAKAVREMLQSHGIEMSFYDKKGEFSGIENMLSELAKLRKLSTLDQQKSLNLMFGAEAGRPAQIMTTQGLERYRANLQAIDDQADLDSRITMKMETFANKLEALGGAVENAMARMAAPVGEKSKPYIDLAAEAAGNLGDFFERNPRVGAASTVGLGAAGAYGAWRAIGGLRSRFMGGAASAAAAAAPGAAQGAAAAAGASYSSMWNGASPSEAARLAAEAKAEKAAARTATGIKWVARAGRLVPLAAWGLESYGAMTDDRLTEAGKARGVLGATAGAAGGWGGAWAGGMAGAALGSAVPIVGTAIGAGVGALLGGLGGYYGGKAGLDWLLPNKPERDIVKLTDPKGALLGTAGPGGATEISLGQGQIQLDVRVTDDRVSVSTRTVQDMPLIRVDAGSTDPGSFSAGQRSAF